MRAAACCVALLLAFWLAAATLPTAASARTRRLGILPPSNPQYALAVGRNLPSSCSGVSDYSQPCINESVGMLNAGRLSEGLGPLLLPANWQQLTVARQLFVLTDLERTARGVEPEAGLSPAWSTVAEAGAAAGRDPANGIAGATDFGSLWAGGEPNPVVVVADWIYEDGLFADGSSENLYCTPTSQSACWAHRDLLLQHGPSPACDSRCVVGAGYSPFGYRAAAAGDGHDSYAEVLGTGGGSWPMSFTWASERNQLPACERAGDSCSWAGSPLLTAGGLRTSGSNHAAPPSSRPSFAVNVRGLVGAAGRVSLTIRVGARLVAVSATARLGRRIVRLRVRCRSAYQFTATGRLSAGRWMVTLRYRLSHTRRSGALARMAVSVPHTA